MLDNLKRKVSRFVRNPDELIFESALKAVVVMKDGTRVDLGVIARRVVTTAGVNYLVAAFQNSADISTFKYHGSGTGTNAENISDTGLQTPVESRLSGFQEEGASANIYRTVATIPYTVTREITEHGIFSANTDGTLWDRSVFGAISVVDNDSIEFTYELTCTAGG